MRSQIVVGCGTVALVLTWSGCGGGGSPSGPTTSTGGPSTISIVGERGAQSFSPNPGTGGSDQSVIWRNTDTVTHRIVLNDSAQDTGDLAPGASSRVVLLPADGTNYHCSIHPGMVGAVRATGGAPPPPCSGAYC